MLYTISKVIGLPVWEKIFKGFYNAYWTDLDMFCLTWLDLTWPGPIRPSLRCCIPSLKVIGLLMLEKKIFKRVFTIHGHGAHLGHMTRIIWRNFLLPNPIEAPHEIWLWLAQWFLRRCLKSVNDGQMDEGQTAEPAYAISSSISLKAQVS